MSYAITATQLFDSASTAVRHTGVAASIIASLSYSDIEQHAEKTGECNQLLRSLQDEADKRKPTSTGGLCGQLSSAAADHKATVTGVARYFATAAGHAYRRAVKAAMVRASNAVAAGAEQPQNETDAIQFVSEFVDPVNVPFVGVKKGRFIADYESLQQRFVRLATASYERSQQADQSALLLAQLQAALDAAGIEVDGLAATA